MKRSKESARSQPSTKKKQANLFSFFTKVSPKNDTPKSSAGATTGRPQSDAYSKASKPAASKSPNSNAVQRSADSKPTAVSNSKWKKIKLNTKIAVYWRDDNQYYAAVVTKEASDRSRFFLQYEDGESEWLDLRQEKFKFIVDDDGDDDQDDSEEEDMDVDEKTVSTESVRGQKKRPRIHDSDDEEFEFDDAPDDEEEDDDEMDYVDDKEEMDDDQWLVSDGEDEDDQGRKPKNKISKKKANKKPKVTEHKAAPVSVASQSTTARVTPKGPRSSTSSSPTLTPTSLASFSAFSTSTQPNAPKRVTPPSSLARASTSSMAREDADWDGEQALPYRRETLNPPGSHLHNHLKFLRNPKDAQGRAKGQPGYNPRTLQVDLRELKKHNNNKTPSPGSLQW